MEDENEKIAKARKILDDLSSDPKERYLAELRLKNIMDKKAIEDCAFDKGLKHGFDNGIREGISKGVNETIKSIVQRMKAAKVDIKEICRYTGLTIEEIEKL